MEKNNKSSSDSAITRRALPVDALTEILARLPVISLLKFSCVSKSWKTLICSSDFFSKAHERHSNLKHVVMLSENKREFKHVSLRCALNESIVRVMSANHVKRFRVSREIKLYIPDQIRVTTFVGSCHGLICLALTGNDVVLWNPSTRKSNLLPDFGYEYGYSLYRSYGFGYDESSDDYKVAGFYFLSDKSDVLVKVYSLKTGKLARIQNHKGYWMVERPPTFANGRIHWFVRSDVGEDNRKPQPPQHDWGIAYLNLETEKYGMLKKPHSIEFGWGSCMTALPGGSFCVACKFFDNTKVWLVKPDYDVGTTIWTEFDHPITSSKYLTPPTVLENGHIVLLSDGKITILNPTDHSVKYPERKNSREFSKGIAYVESLVSPY